MALLTKWESMTAEERVIHLFSQQSDATMSKAAMEILASPNPTKSQKLRLHYGMQQTRPWEQWGSRRDSVSPVILPVTGRISFTNCCGTSCPEGLETISRILKVNPEVFAVSRI